MPAANFEFAAILLSENAISPDNYLDTIINFGSGLTWFY